MYDARLCQWWWDTIYLLAAQQSVRTKSDSGLHSFFTLESHVDCIKGSKAIQMKCSLIMPCVLLLLLLMMTVALYMCDDDNDMTKQSTTEALFHFVPPSLLINSSGASEGAGGSFLDESIYFL